MGSELKHTSISAEIEQMFRDYETTDTAGLEIVVDKEIDIIKRIDHFKKYLNALDAQTKAEEAKARIVPEQKGQ